MEPILLIIIVIVMGGVTAGIASTRGRSVVVWFFYGFFLFPIAVLHLLLSTDLWNRAKCPFCAEATLKKAKVCPHCTRDLPEGWSDLARKPEKADLAGKQN